MKLDWDKSPTAVKVYCRHSGIQYELTQVAQNIAADYWDYRFLIEAVATDAKVYDELYDQLTAAYDGDCFSSFNIREILESFKIKTFRAYLSEFNATGIKYNYDTCPDPRTLRKCPICEKTFSVGKRSMQKKFCSARCSRKAVENAR